MQVPQALPGTTWGDAEDSISGSSLSSASRARLEHFPVDLKLPQYGHDPSEAKPSVCRDREKPMRFSGASP